ncbi:MAG TPA: recombination mediator RecR [Verrucomicrobiae bacterium]|nr:recombination mediator RecR [Verrucomicrobiae bacterium]
MRGYSEWMGDLVQALSKLPGIGRKSAERIVFYLLKSKREEVQRLSALMMNAKENIFFCEICHNFANAKICEICANPGRDKGVICVVEDPKDVLSVEKTQHFFGTYHVLLGALSALDGIGPDEIQIPGLVERVKKGTVREVILATNPNTEGETTALYISKLLKPLKIQVTRIARGVPVGSNLEYVDQATLARALEGRLPA